MQILSLTGLRSYKEVHELQLELLEKRIRDEIPDTILSLEHADVVTRGRGLQWNPDKLNLDKTDGLSRSLPLAPLPPGVDYAEVERGGDLTYHGPGQWVLYPIVKLGESERFPKKDIDTYLRTLENWMMELLSTYGLRARREPHASGVWVGARKIASIGVAVRKWTTFHGIALNVTTDLSKFKSFSPCGFSGEVMTRLRDLNSRWDSDWDLSWRDHLELRLQEILGINELRMLLPAAILRARPMESRHELPQNSP